MTRSAPTANPAISPLANSERNSLAPRPHVIFVDDHTAFPHATAAANRLRHLASGLVGQGLRATVLITKPGERAGGDKKPCARGEYKGVEFEYTCGTALRPSSFAARRWCALKGAALVLWRILRASREPGGCVLYLFTDSPAICLVLHAAAQMLGVPVLADACEWVPATGWGTRAQIFYIKHLRYRLADGIVCISRYLVDQVTTHGGRATLRLPITVDPAEFPQSDAETRPLRDESFPYFIWCGQLGGYLESVRGVLEAFSLVCRQYPQLVLFLAGPSGPRESERVASWKAEFHIPEVQVRLLGYIDRPTLCALQEGALALLSPLEPDVRSEARFPLKIGEYLMAGRPLIVGGIGDITTYCEDYVNALVYKPGDACDMARKMAWVAANPGRADRIGRAGRMLAEREFDYRSLGILLADFVVAVKTHRKANASPIRLRARLRSEPRPQGAVLDVARISRSKD